MKIKSNHIISIIFTILLAMLIIWNRFIRSRMPNEIVLQPFLNEQCVIIGMLFLCWFSIFIYYVLNFLRIIPRPNSMLSLYLQKVAQILAEKPYFKQFIQLYENTIINGPTFTYDYIYQYIYIKPIIHKIGSKLSYHFYNNPIIPYIFCIVIPRILPWLILLIELVCYQYVHYFYLSLIILVIPLLFKIILYMIKHHAMRSLDYYKRYFDFTLVDNTLHVFFKDLQETKDKEDQEKFSSSAADSWEFFQYLYNIAYQINYRKDVYNILLNSIVYGLISLDFFIHFSLLTGFITTILSFLQSFQESFEPFSGNYL